MINKDNPATQLFDATRPPIHIIRHAEVCAKLGVSNGKLFDMIAKGLFPKPFVIIPGGRAVGWIGADVDAWIVNRRSDTKEDAK